MFASRWKWRQLTTLYSFTGTGGRTARPPTRGWYRRTNGTFYGTTAVGRGLQQLEQGCGTVFKVTTSGTLTTLYHFAGYPGDGARTATPDLVQAADGSCYGTTGHGGAYGGLSGFGTAFQRGYPSRQR